MEAFSLLKYWRGGGGPTNANLRTTTTVANTVRQIAVETDEDNDEDEGPFFDLEFTVTDNGDRENDNKDNDESDNEEEEEEEEEEEVDGNSEESLGTDGEQEFDFAVSSGSNDDRSDLNLSSSPSDDLFFKGRFEPLEPLEPSSLVFNSTEPNSKPQLPISFLKSATKFRVFTLGFKKPKSTDTEKIETNGASSPSQNQPQQRKSSRVKFKIEEVPIVSLFNRDNSSRNTGIKINNQSSEDVVASEEKKFAKDIVQKYLKMIKPIYVRGSKRYGEKLGFSGQLSLGLGKSGSTVISKTSSSPTHNESESVVIEANASQGRSQKQGNFPAGLRVVCKHLGKSRSASSTVAAVPSVAIQPRRVDDSLLQQQDGIQSAILHCKRSFNASRDSDSSAILRSTNDLSQEKPIEASKTSFEVAKEAHI